MDTPNFGTLNPYKSLAGDLTIDQMDTLLDGLERDQQTIMQNIIAIIWPLLSGGNIDAVSGCMEIFRDKPEIYNRLHRLILPYGPQASSVLDAKLVELGKLSIQFSEPPSTHTISASVNRIIK